MNKDNLCQLWFTWQAGCCLKTGMFPWDLWANLLYGANNTAAATVQGCSLVWGWDTAPDASGTPWHRANLLDSAYGGMSPFGTVNPCGLPHVASSEGRYYLGEVLFQSHQEYSIKTISRGFHHTTSRSPTHSTLRNKVPQHCPSQSHAIATWASSRTSWNSIETTSSRN